MPYRISRLGTVEIRSLDLDRDLDYYVNVLGLQLTAREGRTAYLKGWDERHAYSVMLTGADQAGMARMAFRTVDPEDLDYYENRLRKFSVKYDVIPEDYRRGRALRFTAPSGHVVELYNEMDYTGNLLPTVNPAPWPEGLKGIAPPRLDHTLVTAPDPPKAIQFFQEVLEFRVSEMLVNPEGVPVAAWLWQRPAPHDIAIVPGRAGGFHHAAFTVDSAEALFRAADILTMHKARIDCLPSDPVWAASGSRGARRSISSIRPATASRRLAVTRPTRWIRTAGRSSGRRTRSDQPSSTTPRS